MSDAPSETAPKRLSLTEAMALMTRFQERDAHRAMRLTVRINNPGGLIPHQTVDVQQIYAGFDWLAGQLILEPAQPLTPLTAEQVEAIHQSVRESQSWHAYQREKTLRARIADLEAELAAMRAT